MTTIWYFNLLGYWDLNVLLHLKWRGGRISICYWFLVIVIVRSIKQEGAMFSIQAWKTPMVTFEVSLNEKSSVLTTQFKRFLKWAEHSRGHDWSFFSQKRLNRSQARKAHQISLLQFLEMKKTDQTSLLRFNKARMTHKKLHLKLLKTSQAHQMSLLPFLEIWKDHKKSILNNLETRHAQQRAL